MLSDWPADLEEIESFILQEWFHSISGSNYEIKFSWEIYWNNCFPKLDWKYEWPWASVPSRKSFTIPGPAGTAVPFFHSIRLVPAASRDTATFIRTSYSGLVLALTLTYSLPVIQIADLAHRLHSPSECWSEGALWKLPEGRLTPWFFRPRRGCVAAPLCICWTESFRERWRWVDGGC